MNGYENCENLSKNLYENLSIILVRISMRIFLWAHLLSWMVGEFDEIWYNGTILGQTFAQSLILPSILDDSNRCSENVIENLYENLFIGSSPLSRMNFESWWIYGVRYNGIILEQTSVQSLIYLPFYMILIAVVFKGRNGI